MTHTPPADGATPTVSAVVRDTIDGAAAGLVRLSHQVHAAAELGFAEHRSVGHVRDLLAASGLDVEVGCHGQPTAFRAMAGSGMPRVAILAEYDALPGIGHGCGHNVICATAVGAFLGLAPHIKGLGGSVVLLGTPAEENGSGKELMARAGAFDDVDAVLMLHPFAGPDIADFTALGCRAVEVTYRGVPAHASATPHMGRNALDAVVAAYQGLAALRQHMPQTDRVHAIITEGGTAVNVVPALARATVMLRSATVEGLLELTHRVQAILDGAAQVTGTVLEAAWDPVPPYLPVRTNTTLAGRYAAHVTARGRTVVHPDGLPSGGGGSTDLGNISLRVPAIHPMLGIAPAEAGMHTAAFAEHAAASPADRAVVDGAIGLALTAVDYLSDPVLRAAVAAEFAAAGGPVDVAALLDTVATPAPSPA
ncbi:amidohydrolase [Blastococcus saxobsidens]|uniref:Peptidase M20 domain-containing protein 2 n=1 Tax=Blastococcus saxobsidens (strain DD2) TaxID=1146883 RepID=H6RX13_BLASD|nr:amidohydrolase [Blastococcus saxobsidens]CCG03421.1 Amidohydrolase [Blastococcus saxobsidens DD2]